MKIPYLPFLKITSTVDSKRATLQRNMAFLGGTDRHNFTKKRGSYIDNRN